MGINNQGNQIILTKFETPIDSPVLNKLLFNIIDPGVYSGLVLIKLSDTVVTVSPGDIIINDKNGSGAVKASFGSSFNITLPNNSTNWYIVCEWEQKSEVEWYVDIFATAAVEPYHVILGRCSFSGGILNTTFDLSERTDAFKCGVLKNQMETSYVRYDTSNQNLSTTSKGYARTNIDVYSKSECDTLFINASGGDTINGNLTITGDLFADLFGNVTGSLSGNASTVTNGVYISSTQTITGAKTFQNSGGLTVKYGSSNQAIRILPASTANSNTLTLTHTSLTAGRTITFPNSTGTVALTSDLHSVVTIGTANGLSISGQSISLAAASSSSSGAVTTGTQTFAGSKTFSSTINGSITGNAGGNAATASRWSSSRTITLTGNCSGSTTIRGDNNVSLSVTVTSYSHTHSTLLSSTEYNKLTQLSRTMYSVPNGNGEYYVAFHTYYGYNYVLNM